MDYYQSDSPPSDDSGFSGAVGFKLSGQIATQKIEKSQVGYNYSRQSSSSPTIVTIQICVDGTPMSLDVYAAGNPY
jgi:hypothetical protein